MAKPRINTEAVKALIEKDGHSISSFASEAAIDRSHLSNILAGRRGCTPAIVKRMADTLHVPQSALLCSCGEAA